MTPILQYLLKLSVSLAVVFIFYHLVLRKLTFYNWNRWYLVTYTLLSFFIPFIDISPVLNQNEWTNAPIVKWLPAFQVNTPLSQEMANPVQSLTIMQVAGYVVLIGMAFMLVRLMVQLISFRRLLKKAKLIQTDGMKLYQVNESIIPFSFGNSIFINRSQHTEEELQEIILHEFVHVKQRHSVDIIWSELLCLFNWYNPFAWMIRKSIRQNLEFIADNQVLRHGMDRKEYQYLLLKVIGNNHFSIASKFNFSSLKKRIAMMNKMKSAGVHLVKFLFVLPLVAVLLVAFRNNYQETLQEKFTKPATLDTKHLSSPVAISDTVPNVKIANSKGYLIDIKDNNGDCMVVVKDKAGKEIKRVLLNEWKEKFEEFEEQYGEILAPPAQPAVPVKALTPVADLTEVTAPLPPLPAISSAAAAPCVATTVPCLTHASHENEIAHSCDEFEITDKLAIMKLKNGKIEKFDLTNPEQKAKFEAKYGKVITTKGDAVYHLGATVAAISNGLGHTVIAPVAAHSVGGVQMFDETSYMITGKEDILVTITKNTTRQELDKMIVQMKEKGIELSFDEIEYNEKGKLVVLSGRMKSKDGQSNFTVNDFEKLILAMHEKDDKTYFKVNTKQNKEVI